MLLTNLFEDQTSTAGLSNLRNLLSAVENSADAQLMLGGEPITLTYPEARYMVGRYKAYLKANRQAEFIRDMGDAVRFDLHMKELRKLLDKQRRFQGSVPGERGVSGDVPKLDEAEYGFPTLSPRSRGAAFLEVLRNTMRTAEPVTLDFGTIKYRIENPADKKWFVDTYEAYRKKGGGEHFLINMGTAEGFQELAKMLEQTPADTQMGRTGSKKKSSGVAEASDQTSARARRMIDRIRSRQPQARSDIEALAFDLEDQQERDRQDIEKLEKDRDNLETSIKSDLEKSIKSLRGRKGVSARALDQIQNTDREQSELINRILDIDRQQSKAIQDLQKATGARATANVTTATPSKLPSAPIAAPTITPEPEQPSVIPVGGGARRPVPVTRAIAPEPEPEVKKSTARRAPRRMPAQISIPLAKPNAPRTRKPKQMAIPIEPAMPAGSTVHESAKVSNKLLWENAVSTAQKKFDCPDHPAVSIFAEQWYRAHGGTWK